MFYTKPDLSMAGIYQEPLESSGTASDWDVLGSAWKSQVEANSFLSGEWNLRSTYDDHNKKVKELTGEELANPQFDLRMDPFQGSNKDRAAYWESYRNHQRDGGELGQKEFMDRWIEQNYRQQLERIAAKYPELRSQLLPDVEFQHQAYQRAQKAEKNEREVWDRSNKGVGAYAAWMAGGLGAAAVDPINWLTAPIGWGKAINGARGLALAFAKGGAANALVEGIIQFTPGGVQDYRSEAGLYSGVGPGLEAMQGAFLFGGLLDAGGRSVWRGQKWLRGYEAELRGDEIIGWRKKGTAPDVATPSVAPLPTAEIPDDLRQRAAAGDAGAQAEIMARLQDAEQASPTPKADDGFIPVELAKRAEDGDTAAIREIARITGQDKDPVTMRALDEMDINEALVEPPDPSIKPSEHVKGIDQALRHVSDPTNEPPPVVRSGRTMEDVLDLEDKIATLEARLEMNGLDESGMRWLEGLKDERLAMRRELMSDEFIGAIDSGEVSPDVAGVVLDHVDNKAIQARAARDLMEREPATPEQARRELAEVLSSPDYRESPFDGGNKQLDDPYGPDAARQVEGLERELAEELGLDPADITKTAEVKPREAIIKEAVDRADAVRAAINDLADIIPEEVNVRVFSAIDQLPPSIRGQVANANARLFGDALRQFENAKTVSERAIARANLDAAKAGLGVEGIADGPEIWISSYAMNPTGRVAHEVVHALRTLGKIAPEELEALAERSLRAGYFTANDARLYRAELESRGYDAATVKDLLAEEAAAHIIDARVKSGVTEADARAETILGKVMEFFERVRSRLRGQGFMTAAERAEAGDLASNDAMRAFLTGEMARREANGDWSRKSPDYRKDVVDLREKIGKLERELQNVPAEVRYRDPETGDPMRDSDVNAFVDSWKFVKSMRAKKGPKTLSQFIVERGGLYDGGGDVMQLLGDYRQRPGLINRLGEDIDDMALAAWEAGFIPTPERATINDLLNMLYEDLGGNPIYRAGDAEFADQLRLAQEMENDLAEAGIRDAKSASAVRKHFDGSGAGGASGRSADTIRAEIEKARTELEAAQRGQSDAAMFAMRNNNDSPRLSVQHNLSPENLEFADKMGGLAVPSLALTKEGAGVGKDGSFGSITLIGRKDLGDPAINPTYDADAWTTRFPKPDYKAVPSKVAQKFVDEMRPFAAKYNDSSSMDQAWDYMVNTPDPERNVGDLLRSSAAQAMFLDTKGIQPNPVMKNSLSGSRNPWVDTKAFKGFLKSAPDDWASNIDPVRQDLSDAVSRAIDEYVSTKLTKDGSKLDAVNHDRYVELYRESWLDDAGLFKRDAWGLQKDAYKIGKKEVDVYKTRERLEKALKPYASDFKNWLDDKVVSAYGEPRIKKDGKWADYTLDNIVSVMSANRKIIGQEDHFTFGEGKARAESAKKITDLTEARNRSEWQMSDVKSIEEGREKSRAALAKWRDNIVPFNKYVRNNQVSGGSFSSTFEALDGSMRALARWAKSGNQSKSSLRAALAREDFTNVSDDVLDEGVKAGKLFLEAPVPYFEVKPQRAVKLDEFAGAVVPHNTSKESIAILERHGIKVKKYRDDGTGYAQANAAAAFTKTLSRKGDDVLFAIRNYDREPVTPGLDMSQAARLQRAREMGFDTDSPVYSGRYRDFNEFRDDRTAYFTEDPEYASQYANPSASSLGKSAKDFADPQPNVVKAFLKKDDLFDTRNPEHAIIFNEYTNTYGNGTPLTDRGLPDWTDAEPFREFVEETGLTFKGIIVDEGGVPMPDGTVKYRGASYAIFDPSNIRSVNAAFDPARADSPNLMFALGGNRTAQDKFGFYSKALEAARGLKQSKGTPEQMLSQLVKAGVKKAEIEATGLEAVMRGERSVTKAEIVEHLELSQVKVMEGRYGSQILPQQQEKIANERMAIYDKWQNGEMETDAYRELDARLEREQFPTENESQSPKWSSYSVDPSNPTYRETVLHLPPPETPKEMLARGASRQEQDAYNAANFYNGHFSEPNAISHLRTSIQPDAEGRSNFVINELQSDWGQKLRKDGGARDEAKIAELTKIRDETARKLESLRTNIMDDVGKDIANFVSIHSDWLKARGALPRETIESILGVPDSANRQFDSLPQAGKDALKGGLYSRAGAALKELNAAKNELSLRNAEIETQQRTAPGNPLVNSTDQWVTTGLRRALRQAVEADADYIAIASGDTVISFKMGAPEDGARYAYNEMYPKKLRDIIKKIDPEAANIEITSNLKNSAGAPLKMKDSQDAVGVARFPITDKLRQSVMEEGQPLFAMRDMEGRKKFGASERAQLLQDDIAEIEAKFANAEGKDREKLHAKRAALLNSRGLERALDDADSFRDMWGRKDRAKSAMYLIESFGESKAMDAKHLQEAIQNKALEGMQKLIWRMRKGAVLGDLRRTKNKAVKMDMDDMIRAAAGEEVNNPDAKEFAQEWTNVTEYLRQRFNAAGGDIKKLKGWFAPQYHNAESLLNAGKDAWVDRLMQDGVLDRDRMVKLSGEALTEPELRTLLREVWETITTDGANKRDVGESMGRGAMYKKHMESRVLHFKNADAWLNYNKDFGGGDVYAAMIGHTAMMARDIALMERFGPNPHLVWDRLKNTLIRDASMSRSAKSMFDEFREQYDALVKGRLKGAEARAQEVVDKMGAIHAEMDALRGKRGSEQQLEAKRQELFAVQNEMRGYVTKAARPDEITQANQLLDLADEMSIMENFMVMGRNPVERTTRMLRRADEMMQSFNGNSNVPASTSVANAMQATRNYISASLLPFASISAISDQATQLAARKFIGMPASNQLSSFVKGFTKGDRQTSLAVGLGLDQARNAYAEQIRMLGSVDVRNWSGFIADRTHAYSGLAPMTQASKIGFGLDFMRYMASHQGKDFAALPGPVKTMFDRHGVSAADWDAIRSARPETQHGSGMLTRNAVEEAAGTDLAEKYMMVLMRERAHAVLEGTYRSRTTFISNSAPGSLIGEVARSAALLKSFPTTYMLMIIGRVYREALTGNKNQAAAYATAVFVGGTLMGALAIQLKNLAHFRDPDDMTKPEFWGKAFAQSGGLGIFGDFIGSSVNRFGESLGDTAAGPIFSKATELNNLTIGNVYELAQGKDTKFPRELVRFMRGNTPLVPFYLRVAYERMILDNILRSLDPDADQVFRRQKQKLKSRTGQRYSWEPGESAPRAPNFGAAIGRSNLGAGDISQNAPDVSDAEADKQFAGSVTSTGETIGQDPPVKQAANTAEKPPVAKPPRSKRKPSKSGPVRGQNRIPTVA